MIIWILATGALLRLTRLIVKDRLTASLRADVIRRYGPTSLPADLIACPWCMSFWLALPIYALASMLTGLHAAVIIPAALTGSYLAGILSERLEVD